MYFRVSLYYLQFVHNFSFLCPYFTHGAVPCAAEEERLSRRKQKKRVFKKKGTGYIQIEETGVHEKRECVLSEFYKMKKRVFE